MDADMTWQYSAWGLYKKQKRWEQTYMWCR